MTFNEMYALNAAHWGVTDQQSEYLNSRLICALLNHPGVLDAQHPHVRYEILESLGIVLGDN